MTEPVRPIAIPAAFWPFLRALNTHEVLYLVVGGHGVIYHGYPRVTADLDLLVEQSEPNIARLRAALSDLGYSATAAVVQKDYHYFFTLGRPPFEVDIISGPSYQACPEIWADCIHTFTSEMDIPVRVISLEQLRQSKRRLGRTKDLADIEELDGR